ncbi:hypothetical protein NQD34_002080 [Periophthalmus magnuspinnatus]|nr:hypothetical protein NQD34_002080 [Periophthalmus magnuspinnatus]
MEKTHCIEFMFGAMACCQVNIDLNHLKGSSTILAGRPRADASPTLAKDWIRKKETEEKRGTPDRSAKEGTMLAQTAGSTRACVRLASMCECLGKLSLLSLPTEARTQTHCCPAWNTWYISSGIWPR